MSSTTARDGDWSVTRYDAPLGSDGICESHRHRRDKHKVTLHADGRVLAHRACGPGWRFQGKYPTVAAARAALR